jgi:predicted AlkP superfamily pyrophosphatase or phosphodiesterase
MMKALFMAAVAALGTVVRAQEPVSPAAARVLTGEARRPRLVVVISVDQLRADLVSRCADLFLPARDGTKVGGFRYLMEEGAYYVNARYEHTPLFTGPGHAVISTGAPPARHGIVGNMWWDPVALRPVYCVEDAAARVVGAAPESKATPMSAHLLRSSTVGDELKEATAGRSKVVSLAVKDRAAILLGGHAQDACVWYDTAGGRWISSSAFCRNGTLPAWAQAINGEHIPDRMLGKEWAPTVDEHVLEERCSPPGVVGAYLGSYGKAFPHRLGTEATPGFYRAFIYTPECNEFVLNCALRAVEAEGMGKDDAPDLLSINLSTNDYVGHAFGPYSPEVLDLTVRTDRALAEFFRGLDAKVPGGLGATVIVLTGDHGVSPIPEGAAEAPFALPAGRFKSADVLTAIETALNTRFGSPTGGSWFSRSEKDSSVSGAWLDNFIWLSEEAVRGAIAAGKAPDRRTIEQVACDGVAAARIPGVYGCYGKLQVLEGRIGDPHLRDMLARGVYPSVSADLVVVPEQMHLAQPDPEKHATSHGTPYIYDAHVPVLIAAPGLVRPGVHTEVVSPADIAPTLSMILRVEMPSGCEGKGLTGVLQGR